MLLKPVRYVRPATVEAAVASLGEDENARALAGGQTLLNVMKLRAAAPDVLVDLAGIAELRTIGRGEAGELVLGATVTYADVIASADVHQARPVLARVCGQIADVQVRNLGTVGGNVCASDPTNHLPPLMVSLGASMTIAGPEGERTVPAEDFFLGVYFTAVSPGELLTAVRIPPATGGDGFASVTIGREGTCIVNAAASVDGGGPKVALGCVAAVPELVRPTATDEEEVREAVRAAGLDPPSDVHASAEYRRHLAEVLAVRAVREAVTAR
ncbi:MAG: xanthine dehydrogenase family protein subunit M [Gaiellaceae bacterium]